MRAVYTGLLAVLALAAGSLGKAVLNDNKYTDFVIAISPDVPQDDTLISGIQSMMNDASRVLYKATRNRAYFRTVKILLPKTWTHPDAVPLEDESFETAEFRVDTPNSVYGDAPYTLQSTECGVPGTYTHLTTGYIKDGSQWGDNDKGKTLVHEFAKLRWGVFEEHGYPGDEQFPMYVLNTVWTSEGQKISVKPNFCVNAELRGYEQDMMTGGACKADPSGSGLPDGNCVFYPTQETAATSSIMAIPFLTTNNNFCDDQEEFIHNSQLPTKQNLYCNGRSTWDVILDHSDFANNNNLNDSSITNTDPDIIIVGGEENAMTMSYAIVMDISKSMVDDTLGINRLVPMQDAAKRFINFDLPENTPLGLSFFSDSPMPGFDLQLVNDVTRPNMTKVIDDITLNGRTCIGGGLEFAMNYDKMLNKTQGNVIILITDGKQDQPVDNCITIKDATNLAVERKTRVITIALGNEADPEIEDLAEATGGKSYYVEDGSGPGDFSDALTGSTTYQPADSMGNTSVVIYQKDWTYDADKDPKDPFEVDMSIGRQLTFKLEVTHLTGNCAKDMNITIVDPEGSRTDLTFRCSKDNFGIFTMSVSNVAVTGMWHYVIKTPEAFESLSVTITSKAKEGGEPIRSKCWLNQDTETMKLSAMAEVQQGNKPVLGAKVEAYIERPSDTGEILPPLTLELLDNGAAADSIKNDGIYTRYFTKYTGVGRYSVKCQVTGSDSTEINEGFIVSREHRRGKRSLPMQAGTPICCGSDTVRPDSKLSKTGNFTRQAAGGSFQVLQVPVGDTLAPSRIMDLKTSSPCGNFSLEFTSPGDDLDSVEKVKSYTIKFASNPGNLTGEYFNNGNNTLLDQSYVLEGDLNPVDGGTRFKVTLDASKFANESLVFFAVMSDDEAGNKSPVSNVASVIPECKFRWLEKENGVGTAKASAAVLALSAIMAFAKVF